MNEEGAPTGGLMVLAQSLQDCLGARQMVRARLLRSVFQDAPQTTERNTMQLTMLKTTSALDAKDTSLSWSSSDAIGACTPSCSRSLAFAGERTGAVITNVSNLGCFKRRLTTAPPTYPALDCQSQSLEAIDVNNPVWCVPVAPKSKIFVFSPMSARMSST